MFDFLKKIKNLAIITLSEDLNWFVDKRPELGNIEKVAVVTKPESHRQLKRVYKGADIFFKYVDEMFEVAQVCDCAMFIGTSMELVESYLKIAKPSNNLKYIVIPTGLNTTHQSMAKVEANGSHYDIFNLPLFTVKSTEKKIDVKQTEPATEIKKTEPELKMDTEVSNTVEAPVAKTSKGRRK